MAFVQTPARAKTAVRALLIALLETPTTTAHDIADFLIIVGDAQPSPEEFLPIRGFSPNPRRAYAVLDAFARTGSEHLRDYVDWVLENYNLLEDAFDVPLYNLVVKRNVGKEKFKRLFVNNWSWDRIFAHFQDDAWKVETSWMRALIEEKSRLFALNRADFNKLLWQVYYQRRWNDQRSEWLRATAVHAPRLVYDRAAAAKWFSKKPRVGLLTDE
jgi:hypothetical protein